MKRCSYTWEKWDEEESEYAEVECPEETWSSSKEYCIFHDPSSEKDTQLFKQELKEKLSKKDYNFKGYHFPEGTHFKGIEFGEEVDFKEATFQKADFAEATFQERADFSFATFQKADFRGATFQYADYSDAKFQKYANFRWATFQYADYSDAKFQEDANFGGTTFHKDANFTGVTFQKANFWKANFREYTNLWEATFQRVDFRELERIYRNLKQKMQQRGDYSQAGECYYREMEMKRKGTKLSIGRLWLEFYRRLAGYGEKPELVIRNSFFVILIGAILFFFCGVSMVNTESPIEEDRFIINYSLTSLDSDYVIRDFGYCLYYSVVTFTTLGYGDIHPLGYSRLVASVEALIGVFFMALFVVVFARKMMR